MKPSHVPQRPKLRCVIYTRVSSDAGLEQEFNSLDNQREAGEAYVRSQAHEGWGLISNRYDDGGFSGGSLERPALKQLLIDIQARLIDIVVVYKVDRLTRSLADFARLVELFDGNGVSFVSVTQAFNTTNSMGRLTLNVLLSFAQFEREVTGERIRDKIAASKKKGLWMGGPVPLGYRVVERKLVVDAIEAAQVRMLFRRYIELRSLPAVIEVLQAEGFVTRKREGSGGKVKGGVALTSGPLSTILRNRVYLGEINHRDRSFPGEHLPIIDIDTFDVVQAVFAANRNHRADKLRSSGAILMGRIFDDNGNRMSPSFAVKHGARYRYYISVAMAQGRKHEAGSLTRVPAEEIERVVIERLRIQTGITETAGGIDDRDLVQSCLDRVVIRSKSIELHLVQDADAPDEDTPTSEPPITITVAWQRPSTVRRRQIILPPGADEQLALPPIRAEARARLLMAIAKARHWVAQLLSGDFTSTADVAAHNRISERSVRNTLPLAFLAPDLVKAIADGSLSHGAGITALADLPMIWNAQRAKLMPGNRANRRVGG